MNTSELAELFLTSLYDLAESEGHSKLFYLNDFATKIGVNDIGKIIKAAEILDAKGLCRMNLEAECMLQFREKGVYLLSEAEKQGLSKSTGKIRKLSL
jgi:hypothetical protein